MGNTIKIRRWGNTGACKDDLKWLVHATQNWFVWLLYSKVISDIMTNCIRHILFGLNLYETGTPYILHAPVFPHLRILIVLPIFWDFCVLFFVMISLITFEYNSHTNQFCVACTNHFRSSCELFPLFVKSWCNYIIAFSKITNTNHPLPHHLLD
jgi:hypothetical protein